MFDTIKYKGQISKVLNFANDFNYVTWSYIKEVFGDLSNETYDEIEKYFISKNIDIIKDDNEDSEPSDEELIASIVNDYIDNNDVNSTEHANFNDLVRTYLNDIGRIPLLDYEQELKCALDIQAGNKAEKALVTNKLTKEERANLKKISMIGLEARQLLVESNLRLVVSIAKHYVNRGLTFMDLIQEGNIGLIKAVYKFDPNRGFRFSTYGTWWIRQAITRAIADKGRIVRLPVHMVDAVNKVMKERNILVQTLKKEPTNQELAEHLGISKEKVDYLLQISQDILSLDQTIDEEEDMILSDVIPDNTMVNPGEYLENAEYREKIDKMLKTLTPREERIIRLRYGLDDNVIHTLEDIAREFNITRERVRQLEIKAIRRLRHPSRIKIIKEK